MSNQSEKLSSIATYLGDIPPQAFFALNPDFDFENEDQREYPTTTRRMIYREGQVNKDWFIQNANEDGLDKGVKILPLPINITRRLSTDANREMRKLREDKILTSLRGDRLTDLARPLSEADRNVVQASSPALMELVRAVEEGLKGSDLFVRAIKYDSPRVSTTQAEADVFKPNLHFDGEKSSLNDYNEPVFQYFANLSILPRQFRVLPVPRPVMIARLIKKGLLTEDESMTLPLEEVMNRFLQNFNVPLQNIIVESGQLAMFAGRVFAHDAGKGRMNALPGGKFKPTTEPDFIVTLDSAKTGYHVGSYDPEQSIFDDPGTDAWWEMMARFKSKQ